MEALKTQLDNYVPVNDRQRQVAGEMKNLLPDQVPEAEEGKAVIADTIRDTFPPELLYHPDVLAGPTTLYHVIRGVFVLLSRPFSQVRINGIPSRVSLGVTRQIYEDEDAELALTLAESFYRSTLFQNQPTGHNQNVGGSKPSQPSHDVGHRLGQRYSKFENKFAGGDSEDIILSLREYDRSADDFQATSEQRLQFLHNIFHGEAKRFYLDHVDGAVTFEDAKGQLISHFCSKSRQVRAQQILETLRVRNV
jgi:hypothetical protein